MILKPIDITTYSQKAEQHIGVFGSLKWLSIYGDALSAVGIFKDDTQLIGGFYFCKTKKFGLPFLKLPPYTPHCGLFFKTEGKNKSSLSNFSKDVMNEIVKYLDAQKSMLTVLAFPHTIVDLQPFVWQKYKVVPNYTYQIQLQTTFETITSHFDSKNRNVINKALKEGVQVNENELDNSQLFDFFMQSLSTTNANIYENELKQIFFTFADTTNSFSLSAKKDGILLGVVFCIFDQNVCYYLLGGVNKKAGTPGVNNLLVQKSIEKAQSLNCQIFDFEGSMLKGVEKFFRSFGPDLIPYFTVNRGTLPLEILLKFKKRELF
jgi:lipid II:glycine glycyltransferase (peptidoglycan interpeptide bridge formation enzyme)